MIQHSDELRRIFKQFVSGECEFTQMVDNLRAAKHRFESMQKPLGRACIHLKALIKTALHIAALRTDKQAKRAEDWLLFLSDEVCLTLAMLADAGDEALLLTRLLDDEDVDVAVANSEVQAFACKIDALFGEQRKCLDTVGYTSMMLALLSNPIVFTVRGKTKSVGRHGGVTQAVIDSCMARMNCWRVLARATLSAEFPDFEFLTALAAFNGKGNANDDCKKQHLGRVAHALGVDSKVLIAQFNDMFPRVKRVIDIEGMTNTDAWQNVIKHIKASPVLTISHPTEELEMALIAYVAYGASTSGVEQSFAKGSWMFTNRQLKSHPDVEEAMLKLGLDLPHNDQKEVVKVARRLWAHCYGAPRHHDSVRIDAGVKRERASEPGSSCDPSMEPSPKKARSEIEFLRARRQAAREVSQDMPGSGFSIPDIEDVKDMEGWGEGHSKELEFIKNKLHKRKVQAAFEKALLPSEDTLALQLEGATTKAKMIKDQRARDRKSARTEAYMSKTAQDVMNIIKGKTVFVEPEVSSAVLLIKFGCNSLRPKFCHEAEVFVVDDVAAPGKKVRWASAIRGSYVMSPSTVLDNRGGILKMKPAIATKRTIFVSEGCRREHSALFKFIDKVVKSEPGANWTWMVDQATFLALKVKHPKFAGVVGLVRAAEKSTEAFAGVNHIFSLDEFLEFISNHQPEECVPY